MIPYFELGNESLDLLRDAPNDIGFALMVDELNGLPHWSKIELTAMSIAVTMLMRDIDITKSGHVRKIAFGRWTGLGLPDSISLELNLGKGYKRSHLDFCRMEWYEITTFGGDLAQSVGCHLQ